jgi:hypothetical protein
MGSRKKKILNQSVRSKFIAVYNLLSAGEKIAFKNAYWARYRMNFLEIFNCKSVMEEILSPNSLKNRLLEGFDYWAGW